MSIDSGVFGDSPFDRILENFGDRNMLMKLSTKEFLDLKFDDVGKPGDHYPILIFSDSQSCLGALSNQGLSRRVRHMSISVCYIQSLKDSGNLVLESMVARDQVRRRFADEGAVEGNERFP